MIQNKKDLCKKMAKNQCEWEHVNHANQNENYRKKEWNKIIIIFENKLAIIYEKILSKKNATTHCRFSIQHGK